MAWATSVGAHWKKIEAEYNAEWAKLAYLDGPGYTVWDRIEAKSDLQRRYFSRSSSHGVVNSPVETLTQTVESHFTFPRVDSSRELDYGKAESNRQHNSRMAEYTRDIRESCARILTLLQEEMQAHELTNDALPTSEENLPSIEPIDEQSTDESVGMKTSMVESVTPIVHMLHLNQDASHSYSITGAFSKDDIRFDDKLNLTLPMVNLSSCKGSLIRLSGVLITSLSSHFVPLLPKPPHPCVFPPSPPPPRKPPDRSFQKIPVDFQVTQNFTIYPPPPEPPDTDHIAGNAISLPSCVALVECPPSVWENVCVNGMEISTGLSNVSVYLHFKEVFVQDMSNDTCVLGCHMFLLNSDWNIFQPSPPFMSSQCIPPVQHHRGNEYEQVILVVYLGAGLYGRIALEYGYTMNVFENTEVYGYGLVLSNVLISKHVDKKWQKAPQESKMAMHFLMEFLSYAFVSKCYVVGATQFIYEVYDHLRWITGCGYVYRVLISKKRSFISCLKFVLSHSVLNSNFSWNAHHSSWFYALNNQGDLWDDYDLTSAYSLGSLKGAPICKCLNGFELMFLHEWKRVKWSDGCVKTHWQLIYWKQYQCKLAKQVISRKTSSSLKGALGIWSPWSGALEHNYCVHFFINKVFTLEQHYAYLVNVVSSSVKHPKFSLLSNNLWLPRSYYDYANSPWYQIVQLLDFVVWVAVIDLCAMFYCGFSIAFNTYTMSTSHTSKYMQLEIKEKHSVKLDSGGMGYFFIIKEFLQFKQWDPGGCSLTQCEGDYLFWRSLGNMLVAHKCIYLNFNLEDKVDFKGDGNVMISIEESKSASWL